MYPSFVLALYCCIILFLLLIVYANFKLLYWKRRHMPYVKPIPLMGNLKDLFLQRLSFGDIFRRLYESADIRDAPIGGIFLLHQPALILRDPDLIKLVFIKHFDKFLNRFEAADCENDAIGALSLPLSKFPIWWGCRKKMAEVFTTGKIKLRMYPLMVCISQELERFLECKFVNDSTQEEGIVVEVKEMCSLFTTDLTSILQYGKDVKGLSLGKSVLRQQVKQLFDVGTRRLFDFFIIFFKPHLTGYLKAKVFSKTYAKFMRQFTQDIYRIRELHLPPETQGDLMDVLLKFQKENAQDPFHYTQHKDFITSQVAIFLLAGFETSSSAMGLILYELAKNPAVQLTLRRELKQAFMERSALSYEEIQNLPYLHQVVCEGLRMYPAASFINRECTGDPFMEGIYLRPDIFIPKGMPVYVSIMGLHRDPKHWSPNPNQFIPERFAPANLKNINPMTYLPFGAGPHACIGSRLGLLQVKLGLAHILRPYEVQTSSRTAKEITFDPKSFMLQAKGGIYLKFIVK